MREHYGETQAQSVSDHKWIAMTAELRDYIAHGRTFPNQRANAGP